MIRSIGFVCLACSLLGCNRPAETGKPSGTAVEPNTTAEPNTAAEPNAKTPADSDKPASNEPAKIPLVASTLAEDDLADGWISLFDGQTLYGWQAHSEADWRVEEGTIRVGSGEPGLLCTTSKFANYVLKLDFHSAPGTNSGVFLRTVSKPTDPAKDCYELNIADQDNPFPSGSFVKREKVSGDNDRDDWQSYEITMDGGSATVKLDGQVVLEYTDAEPIATGHIGLQLNQGAVAFRNIRIRPLGTESIFNGTDLTGWTPLPDMASKFTVSDAGELRVQDGPGQLETTKQYGDFVLQLDCKVHAEHLNSGIFFRCIPGEKMNGYESQIHNGFGDGDRSVPIDCGTGGIFRRQNARLVVADDGDWFHKTIVADGPHFSVWVNGFQVLDWTDTRKPDENPRRGLRTAAGTIIIQGHDPTTDLSFRNLRIAEAP